jgi:hypothetical protein
MKSIMVCYVSWTQMRYTTHKKIDNLDLLIARHLIL